MRLAAVRIQSFKLIEDSQEFSIADVTCLVGKNESGKTAILKALAKLNSVSPSEAEFSPLDYPRRKWVPNAPIPDDPPPIWTRWKLSPEEKTEFEEEFAAGVLTSDEVTVSKGYDNKLRVSVSTNEKVVVARLIGEANLSEQDATDIVGPHDSIDSLSKALSALTSPTERHQELQAKVAKEYPAGVAQKARNMIAARLPKFVYFSEYYTLPGEVALEEFISRKASKTLTRGEQVFEALLDLAGTTAEQIRSLNKFEELNAALRAVSNNISEQIFEYWSQNRHLDAVLRLDAAKPGDPAPFNSGNVFRTRIDNRRHKADTSFDERSSGFVWFFSFLVWFAQLKKRSGKRLIVLLDEPGLTLHARA